MKIPWLAPTDHYQSVTFLLAVIHKGSKDEGATQAIPDTKSKYATTTTAI